MLVRLGVCARQYRLLHAADVFRRGSPVCLFNFELDTFAFCQGTKTRHVDRRMMDEDIRTFFALDETITFFIAEPFYNTD